MNAQEVIDNWKTIQAYWPDAEVLSSTLDNVTEALLEVQDLLPVIELESGDTWIFGPPSDPDKLRETRLLQRERRLAPLFDKA